MACFDTAFHSTMPRMAQIYGLPRELAAEGILRYGFHGLSYDYIAGEAPRGRVIAAHLGNGASLAAIRDGVSVDTSMGFTPTGGIGENSAPIRERICAGLSYLRIILDAAANAIHAAVIFRTRFQSQCPGDQDQRRTHRRP